MHSCIFVAFITDSYKSHSFITRSSPRPVCLVEEHTYHKRMKDFCNLSLLLLAAILVGGAYCCNYERMTSAPRYKDITTPKKVLNLPHPHGICVAENGIFAVMFHVKNGFFHLYYSCGKLMTSTGIWKNAGLHILWQ